MLSWSAQEFYSESKLLSLWKRKVLHGAIPGGLRLWNMMLSSPKLDCGLVNCYGETTVYSIHTF